MAKQIRSFWKNLCAVFAAALGLGVGTKDANAVPANITIPTSAIKSVSNCEYDVFKCVDGENKFGVCYYDSYQATGETARLLAAYINRGLCGGSGVLYSELMYGVDRPTTVTWYQVPRFCYDLWLLQNVNLLIRTYGDYSDLGGAVSCDEAEMLNSGTGVNYNECSRTELVPLLSRTTSESYYDHSILSGQSNGVFSTIKWYGECTQSVARLVGCTPRSNVLAYSGPDGVAIVNRFGSVVEDLGNYSCVDKGCGYFAGDTSVQNYYTASYGGACYVRLPVVAEGKSFSDDSGVYEYVTQDEEGFSCNCFSNGSVVCS